MVLTALRERGVCPARILEPTCGSGAFLTAAAAAFPAAVQLAGIEYQRAKFAPALTALQQVEPRLAVYYANAYDLDFAALAWQTAGPLLVVGNPPWVTAAALGRADAGGLQPPRSNPRRLRGLAARTGAANFDVAEFLLLKLLHELRSEPVHFALLVKEAVARKVMAGAAALGLGVAVAEIVRIDARKWFGVAVDACCLVFTTTPGSAARPYPIAVRAGFGGAPSAWLAAPPVVAPANGEIVFRQGIKHDAADVFELRRSGERWHNGYGERVDIEPEFIFPLCKARALHRGEDDGTALIVPQRALGAPTARLEQLAPRLWAYLVRHRVRLAARKSSIYRNAPEFSLFGLGPYSFAVWKVAVAALYEEPRFRLLGPVAGRPVVLGDTAYFVPFAGEAQARAFYAVCTSPALRVRLRDRIVRAKRPITKMLLDGVDWSAIGALEPPAAKP